MRFIVSLVVVALLCGCSPTWEGIERHIDRTFPEVREIDTGELAEWLGDPRRRQPVLLDVREAREFEVSHLRGAMRVEPGSAAIRDVPKDSPVVTYCSVGYRSAKYAETLQEAGFRNVRNLDGSIFRWANEGRPVYRDGEVVEKVHPYNATWGKLLDENRRAEP